MSSRKPSSIGLVDLEKELTCSICTELLYQPLTLLDCLHTFCGSCLKEWFSWQASSSVSVNRRTRYTCPSCRASVRDTRHDAKVATLLDLFLQANPTKARSNEEKEEIDKKYKPGESVLAVSSDDTDSSVDEHDQRLVAEVREMSLRESSRSRTGSSQSRVSDERSTVNRSRERRLEEARRRRRAERQLAMPPAPRTASELGSREPRQIEHQSSLRSLLSSSDGDSAIEEEILRQITEEGLLDGIDLHNLTAAQEDELSERIAEAYRRRFLTRYTAPQTTQHTRRDQRQRRRGESLEPQSRVARRSRSTSPAPIETTNPPSRVPGASSQVRGTSAHRTVLSGSETRRRRTSPAPRTAPLVSPETVHNPATRSSTELPRPSRSSQTSLSGATSHRRATSSTSATGGRESSDAHRQTRSRSTDYRSNSTQQTADSPIIMTSLPVSSGESVLLPPDANIQDSRSAQGLQEVQQARVDRRIPPPTTSFSSRPSSSRSETTSAPGPTLYPEPSFSCEHCGKRDIQNELHKFCGKCKNGNYSICLRCYRLGHGCLHWFGFGHRAQLNFERKFPRTSQESSGLEPPHILKSRRYLQPPSGTLQSSRDGSSRASPVDPAQRLQEGMFCDMCHSFADDCFWKCFYCNDGEWGFCNRCVNRGRCCTHPLLAIGRIKQSENADRHRPGSSGRSAGSPSAVPPTSTVPREESKYKTLTFSTRCNICTYPIPPSNTRFHCPECNDGDYDICTNCYLKLCASGKISKENGRNGWRRCPSGHRMIIVGFEDTEDGQRRVIVKGLVGGFAMRDTLEPNSPASPVSQGNPPNDPDAPPAPPVRQDSGNWIWKDGTDAGSTTSQRRRINRSKHNWSGTGADGSKVTTPSFPPSGGIGLTLLALWSCYPDPNDTDEIMFPRGAIITEAENINDDWLWGCYAGQTGLFPGSYVRVIDQTGNPN
ncbi:hypothetical protein VTO42DRAFT_1438 [Malbranchea cinnamomea]